MVVLITGRSESPSLGRHTKAGLGELTSVRLACHREYCFRKTWSVGIVPCAGRVPLTLPTVLKVGKFLLELDVSL